MADQLPINKECRICKLIKLSESFYSRKESKDGLGSYCKVCAYEKSRKWKASNPEKLKESDRKSNKKRYQENPEYVKSLNKKYIENNREKATIGHRVANKKHRKNNPRFYVEKEAKHRARKLQAMPKWLNEEQLQQIKDIYINCPEGYHVDHIMPLKNKILSGLHVPWNLQYLTAEDNIKKSNKLLEV